MADEGRGKMDERMTEKIRTVSDLKVLGYPIFALKVRYPRKFFEVV